MCARYEFVLGSDKLSLQIIDKVNELDLSFKQGEVFPSDNILTIIPHDNKVDLKVLKWGIKKDSLQINARQESIKESNIYNDIKDNRCAIICNGFYEWDKDKNKYYMNTKDNFIYLAGIYNSDNELLVITRDAPEYFRNIHDRIPVIMNKDEMIKYLQNIDEDISNKQLNMENKSSQIKLF